jgi:hypothetical protein
MATTSDGTPTPKQLKDALQKVIDAVRGVATAAQTDPAMTQRMAGPKKLLDEAEKLIHTATVIKT